MLSTFFILIREGKIISELFINDQIRDKEVRVIGENGEQLGIMSSKRSFTARRGSRGRSCEDRADSKTTGV